MIIAQLSDLHIMPQGELAFGRFDTAATLARCVAHLMQLKPLPEAVLVSGDLVDGGSAGEYRRLRRLLAPLSMPVYLIPGNHDERGALCAEFRDHAYLPSPGGTVHYVVDGYDVRLVALDTVVAGEPGGDLDAHQLGWLDATLKAGPHKPTLVFMHHPPVKTGMRYLDAMALSDAGASRLGDIVGRHPQVERVVCGHVHRAIQARWGGTALSICPSTAFQAVLDLQGSGFDASTGEPPAYQVHYWNGTELATHTVAVT